MKWLGLLIENFFFRFWLKSFQLLVNMLQFYRLRGPTNDKETRCFVDFKLFKVWARLKSILLHNTKVPPKELIRPAFLKDEISKSNQS